MSKGELSVFMPIRLKKRGGRKMVLVPEGKFQLTNQNASIDTTLVKALVRFPPMATPAEIKQISNHAGPMRCQ
jgi:hypothetical protein